MTEEKYDPEEESEEEMSEEDDESEEEYEDDSDSEEKYEEDGDAEKKSKDDTDSEEKYEEDGDAEKESEDDTDSEDPETEEEDGLFSDLDDLEREIEEDMVEDGESTEGSPQEGEDESDTEETSSDVDRESEDSVEGKSEDSEYETETKDGLEGEEETSEEGEEDTSEMGLELTEDVLASQEVDEHTQQKNIVEGALFVAGRALSMDELNTKTEIRKSKLNELLMELAMEYLERPTAMEIIQIQEKWVLQIKAEYTPKVKKFATTGLIPDRILKTLTIVALKQPMLKSNLIKIRGSGAYEHVKYLLDRGYCEGIKKGRSVSLTTTDQFADTFGLSRDVETLKKQLIIQLGMNK